jgi:Fe-S oxidoreductase
MSNPRPELIKAYLKYLLASLEAKRKEEGVMERCKRTNGSERKWFETVEEALAFQKLHPEGYGADVVTLCPKCGGCFHLSHPDWLPDLPWEIPVSELVVN